MVDILVCYICGEALETGIGVIPKFCNVCYQSRQYRKLTCDKCSEAILSICDECTYPICREHIICIMEIRKKFCTNTNISCVDSYLEKLSNKYGNKKKIINH